MFCFYFLILESHSGKPAFDFTDVLYEFLIRIKNSACGPHAGKGAFLTFK